MGAYVSKANFGGAYSDGAHIWAGSIFGGIFVSHLRKNIIKVFLKICIEMCILSISPPFFQNSRILLPQKMLCGSSTNLRAAHPGGGGYSEGAIKWKNLRGRIFGRDEYSGGAYFPQFTV